MAAKILLVDDEPDVLDVLESRFKSNGYDVVVARDGEQALEKARQEKPDLMILDVKLPKMDGYQVCRVLRSEEESRDIPIVMLTACGKMDEIKTGLDVGAVSYVSKPLKLDVLLGIIKGLV